MIHMKSFASQKSILQAAIHNRQL